MVRIAAKSTTSSGCQYVEHALQKTLEMNVLKTTTTDTQIIDWIAIESQGPIAKKPPPRSWIPHQTQNFSWPIPELEQPGAEIGPPGTVPIPRATLDYLAGASSVKIAPSSELSQGKSKRQYVGKHWYVNSGQSVANHGGEAIFSLYNSYVQSSGDFSLLQVAVVRDNVPILESPGNSGWQTLEAGWINFPLQVSQPHLFTYFTTNDYTSQGNNKGGWNQDVKGWVQVDSAISPGTVFLPNSVIGGTQYDIPIGYYLYEGNWWLYVYDRYIGYYPATLFSDGQADATVTLASGSNYIAYYGEIYQKEDAVTTTDMGSGEFAAAGLGSSAYIRNMNYMSTDNELVAYASDFQADDSSRYSYERHVTTGDSGTYVLIGGPGAGGVIGG